MEATIAKRGEEEREREREHVRQGGTSRRLRGAQELWSSARSTVGGAAVSRGKAPRATAAQSGISFASCRFARTWVPSRAVRKREREREDQRAPVAPSILLPPPLSLFHSHSPPPIGSECVVSATVRASVVIFASERASERFRDEKGRPPRLDHACVRMYAYMYTYA